MKENPQLTGIAVETIPKGALVDFDLENGHVKNKKDGKKHFPWYKKCKGLFDIKSDQILK